MFKLRFAQNTQGCTLHFDGRDAGFFQRITNVTQAPKNHAILMQTPSSLGKILRISKNGVTHKAL